MDRLGYAKYGIQGGDWGSEIAHAMAYQAPAHVIGLHLNLIYATAEPGSNCANERFGAEEVFVEFEPAKKAAFLGFKPLNRRLWPMHLPTPRSDG